MGCPSCLQRLQRARERNGSASYVVHKSAVLSAAQLTAMGWVKTCVVCGTKTEYAPFPEACKQVCECQ